jgi:hypothetical protein
MNSIKKSLQKIVDEQRKVKELANMYNALK